MNEFKKIVDRHRHGVYTFAFYSLGNHEEAEDITQEVLIRLWQNWDGLRRESLTAWLNRVTRNACIDRARQRRAYSRRVVANGTGGDVYEGASSEPSPEAYVESNEIKNHIRHALTQINEPYRSIMILREIQQLKYEEIADTVDLPLNTVKSYLHRGRRMLRDRLKEALSDERV
ncbi:MAG: sigma-70 family RNA polymerase sigma factor [Candidatus Latescibacterota bacterium]|nr:MAG: sigma-70 family RNA polymerase sigma factor [Candidatus Latescibacterota bacterium]